MRSDIRSLAALVVVAVTVALGTVPAAARYPEKPVTLIVPWPAGGVSDSLLRIVAGPLGKDLGQPVVIMNRPGASGVIGTLELERAAPDGYTIGNLATSQIATQYTSANPNSLKRVVPIANLISGVGTLTVKADAPWNSLMDYLEHARKHPGKLRVANAGTGSVSHVHGLLFDAAAGVSQTHIPFKGNAPALPAVAGGHIEATMIAITDVLPLVQGGQLKLLAVGGEGRHPLASKVPTFVDQGVKFDPRNFQGLVAPAGTPAEIVRRLHEAAQRVIKDPAVAKLLEDRGYTVDFKGGADFARFLDEQDGFFRATLKQIDLKKD